MVLSCSTSPGPGLDHGDMTRSSGSGSGSPARWPIIVPDVTLPLAGGPSGPRPPVRRPRRARASACEPGVQVRASAAGQRRVRVSVKEWRAPGGPERSELLRPFMLAALRGLRGRSRSESAWPPTGAPSLRRD